MSVEGPKKRALHEESRVSARRSFLGKIARLFQRLQERGRDQIYACLLLCRSACHWPCPERAEAGDTKAMHWKVSSFGGG